MSKSEVSLCDTAMKLRECEDGRDAHLGLAGTFIVVSKYGKQRLELRYENVRSVKTMILMDDIAQYKIYMDSALTMKGNNFDRPKDFSKFAVHFTW